MKIDAIGVLDGYRNILGWLSYDEAIALQSLTCTVSGLRGDIVEVGSYCGKSTVAIAQALKQGCSGVLYSVDHHKDNVELHGVDSFAELQNNIEKYDMREFVKRLTMMSREAVEMFSCDSVKMLFIDGAHDYESVKEDFELWSKKMVKHGFVAFHDSQDDGVSKVINEIYDEMKEEWQSVMQVGSLITFKKLY